MKFTDRMELTKFLDNYRSLVEDTKNFSIPNKTYAEQLASIELPSFYQIPLIRITYTIKTETNNQGSVSCTVFNEKETPVRTFPNLSEAYDWVKNNFNVNIKIMGDYSANTLNQNLTNLEVHDETRFLRSNQDTEKHYLAIYTYLDFLFLTEKYYNDPDDFYTSYVWFKSHPVFWIQNKVGNDKSWVTVYDEPLLEVHKNKNNETFWFMQASVGVGAERTIRQHDSRLNVFSPTFEEGYIKLAALTDKLFHLDGEERKNVSHTPSELEFFLMETVKESKKNPRYLR